MKKVLALAAILAAGGWFAVQSFSHCEVPCGIYDDDMRFDMMAESFNTIEKAMNQINELSADPGKNANQLIRWVMTKEDHAGKVRDILTEYFLDQRTKPVEKGEEGYSGYQQQLELLHRMMVEVMKCKQTTDLAHVASLRELKDKYYASFFGPGHEKHTHEPHNK